MLEILINLLIAWEVSVIVSVILVVVSLLVYIFDTKRRNYMNEHFGIKEFFSNVQVCGKKNVALLFLLIPILNLIIATACLMTFCTDIGDNV